MLYRDVFSERVSILRKQKKITLQTLGDAIGMTPQSVYNLERGRSSPSFEIFCAIADFFGVSLDYLAGRTNEKYSDGHKLRIYEICMKIFAERLSSLRFDKDCTLQQIGDAIGANRYEVSCFEKGTKTPTFEQICALSDFFNVSFDYLLQDVDADPSKYKPVKTEKEKRDLYDRLLNPKWEFEERMERH